MIVKQSDKHPKRQLHQKIMRKREQENCGWPWMKDGQNGMTG